MEIPYWIELYEVWTHKEKNVFNTNESFLRVWIIWIEKIFMQSEWIVIALNKYLFGMYFWIWITFVYSKSLKKWDSELTVNQEYAS